jgi:hypothetical protein
MFQYGIVAGDLRIEHQHADGTWASMEAREPEPGDAHDAADNDPEREWERGNVYVCTVCQETIRMSEPAAGTSGSGPSAA